MNDTELASAVAFLGHDDWCDYAEKRPEGCEDGFGCGVWHRARRFLASDWLADHVAAAVVAERERIAAALEDEARHPLISNGVTEFTKAARMTFLSAARIARTQGDPA